MKKLITFIFAITLALAPVIANTEASTPEYACEVEINDPLEPLNRVFFGFNRVLDTLILRPVATIYKTIIPAPIRTGVGNFVQNLYSPVYFLNHLLQGHPDAAMATVIRFCVNSTIGIGGLVDIGTEMGFTEVPVGFYDTLGVWGVDTGPYLMLPILGPSTFRGVAGLTADYYSNPINYVLAHERHHKYRWLSYAWLGAETIHNRAVMMETIDNLEKNSADYYAAVRSIHFQVQKYKVGKLKAHVPFGKKKPEGATASVTESPKPV